MINEKEIICAINFYSSDEELNNATIIWGPVSGNMSFALTNSEVIPRGLLVDVLPSIAKIIERENISKIILDWGSSYILGQLLVDKYFQQNIEIIHVLFTRAYTQKVEFNEGRLQYPKWLAELTVVNSFSGVHWINNDMLKAIYHLISARDYPLDSDKVSIDIVKGMILISAYCNYRREYDKTVEKSFI
jgi:hypothetical protein